MNDSIQSRLIVPALSLCQREIVRFLRQRHRVVGALVTPIVFWVFLGAGFGRSFHADGSGGANFMQYFFPGTIIMILLFTAIFSTISIIEDRREGFLQSVLIAPVSRQAVVLGKLLGGTLLAVIQGAILLPLAPLVGIPLGVNSILLSLAIMVIVSFALTGLGFCVAWRMSSTQGFHAIMNLFFMPMLFLSGAMFPSQNTIPAMAAAMRLNPLSYGVSSLREALYIHSTFAGLPGLAISLTVSLLFAAGMFAASSLIARQRTSADLQ